MRHAGRMENPQAEACATWNYSNLRRANTNSDAASSRNIDHAQPRRLARLRHEPLAERKNFRRPRQEERRWSTSAAGAGAHAAATAPTSGDADGGGGARSPRPFRDLRAANLLVVEAPPRGGRDAVSTVPASPRVAAELVVREDNWEVPMGRSRRETRRITVEGVEYRWVLSPNDGYMTLLVSLLGRPGQRLHAYFKYHDIWVPGGEGVSWSAGQRRVVTPRVVRTVILAALTRGCSRRQLTTPSSPCTTRISWCRWREKSKPFDRG